MLKVAFVSQTFENITPPVDGNSISIWTDRVIHAMSNQPVTFTVYARRFGNQQICEEIEGIEYRRVSAELDYWVEYPFRVIEKLFRFPFPKRPFFASVLNDFFYIIQIARDLARLKPDIVHIHNFSQFVPIVRALNPKVKIVLHMHGEWLSDLDYRMIAGRIAQTDLVLTCSDATSERVRQRFPQFAGRIHTVNNGIDPSRFYPSKRGARENGEEKQLLFVGRVSPEKGVHTLIQAMETVRREYPAARLNIVGPEGSIPYPYIVLISDDPRVRGLSRFYGGASYGDRYYPYLLEQARVLNGAVKFLGKLPHSEVPRYFENAYLLVNPSFSEAFGMPIVEAMACQVPVVATRVGGIVNVVKPGETGLLVEPDDPQALAEAILTLLRDETMRDRMGEAGRKFVEECFTWDHIAGNLWHEYQFMMKGE